MIIRALFLVFLFSQTVSAGVLKEKDTFPSVKLPVISTRQPNSKGSELSISSFKGNVVLIDFWASWCEPCKVALPAYNKLYEKYSKKGLAVWGVNVDDDKAEGQSFMKEHPMKFPVSYDVGKKLIKKVGVKTMPTSFLIGKDGKVHHIHEGFREGDEKDLEKLLKKLL